MRADDLPDTDNRQPWCVLLATITSQVPVAQPARWCYVLRTFENLRDFVVQIPS
jgi:hypothetical protein